MSIPSPNATPLPSGVEPYGTAYDSVNNYLYITSFTGDVYRAPGTGTVTSGSATLVYSGFGAYGQLAIDSTNNILYQILDNTSITQLDLNTNTVSTFLSGFVNIINSDAALAYYNGYLYLLDFVNNGTDYNYIYQISVSSPNLSTYIGTGSYLNYPGYIATNGTYLYLNNAPYNSSPSYISTQLISGFSSSGSTGFTGNVAGLSALGSFGGFWTYLNNYLYLGWGNALAQIDLSGTIVNSTYLSFGTASVYDTASSSTQLYMTFTGSTNIYGLGGGVVCFLEGTKILCQVGGVEVYLPVQSLRKGTPVKTLKHGFVPVHIIAKKSINNPGTNERIKDRLYRCSKDNYPELTEDLFITGCHSILMDQLTEEQMKNSLELLNNRVYMTDDKFRLMACVDDKAEPWEQEGEHMIWHFALESDDYFVNYGVYANGLLVESSSKRFIIELSNMDIVE
jgi:hypothetical protein